MGIDPEKNVASRCVQAYAKATSTPELARLSIDSFEKPCA
jgi:hypothetical protein